MNIIWEHAYFEMSYWEEWWQHNFVFSNVVYSIHQINISIKFNYPINLDYHISLLHLFFHL
jgi:hypothetical protein